MPIRFFFKLLLLLSICGCGTVQEPKSSAPTTANSLYQPSLNRVVGEVVWLDEAAAQAVVYLSVEIAPSVPYLLARDAQLNLTAIFEPTRMQRRRSLGVNIIIGTPATGDEVIVPGPFLAERLRQSTAKQRATELLSN